MSDDPASEPFVILGASTTLGIFDFSVNNEEGISLGRDHSTFLLGVSFDLTCGRKGDAEIGVGWKKMGAGINFDSSGLTGISFHYGFG